MIFRVSMKTWDKKFTLEVIQLLHSLPVLWDVEQPDYHSKEARLEDYTILLQKIRTVDPDATINDVKNKIKILRSTLLKIDKRYLECQKRGKTKKPSLYYYDALSFLLPQMRAGYRRKRRRDSCSVDSPEEENEIEETEPEPEPEPEEDTVADHPPDETNQQVVTDCEVFGQYVAAKLISMAHIQRIYLEKMINDAIYQAELGNLTENTRLCREEYYNNVPYIIDMSKKTQYLSRQVTLDGSQHEEILVEENNSNSDQNEEPMSFKRRKFERHNIYENFSENQIVPEAGTSGVLVQRANTDGAMEIFTHRERSEEATTTEMERVHPLPSGAVLERIDDGEQPRVNKVENHIAISDQNRIIYIENGKSLEEAMMCGRSIIIQNGSYQLETVQRQGVIVEKAAVEASARYVVREAEASARYVVREAAPAPAHVLRNVQFADDDLVKMCEDDGIAIICVDSADSAEKTH